MDSLPLALLIGFQSAPEAGVGKEGDFLISGRCSSCLPFPRLWSAKSPVGGYRTVTSTGENDAIDVAAESRPIDESAIDELRDGSIEMELPDDCLIPNPF